MYKVLIVDDEPVIREGLKALLDWEGLGYQVVDTAANAKEALLKFREHEPDLLIVDIRMPGMDGLQLVQELRSQNETLHVLILSGYADFSYAKKAITLSIDGYLLKPVDEDELTGYLKKVIAVLDQEAEDRKRSAVLGGLTRDMLVQSIMSDNFAGDFESMEKAAEDADLSWNCYQVLLIKLLFRSDSDPGKAAAVKAELTSRFDDRGRGVVFSAEPFVGILLKESVLSDSIRKQVYADASQSAGKNELAFVIAAGDKVGRISDIRISYASALERIKHHFFYEQDQIIGPFSERLQSAAAAANEEEEVNFSAISEKLYYALDIGNADVVRQLIFEAGTLMLQAGYREESIKSQFVQMLTEILNRLSQHRGHMQPRSQANSARLLHMYNQSPFSRLLQYAVDFLEEIIEQLGNRGTDFQMKKMIDLIHRNYDENLKLESLAEVFSYNSAYLGKLFKNTTGEYFNTYLDKVRIEKAKELLELGMKVYQVAEKVGFTNVDYFHSKFKKYVGASPSGYRKK